MKYLISEKKFCEDEIEKGQQAIWRLEIEERTLNRQKLGVSAQVQINYEARCNEIKALLAYLKKKQEVLQDRFQEITKEKMEISYEQDN